MRTVWTDLGLKSLEKTTHFIEEQWNVDVADNFLDRLDERVAQLEENPQIGPTYGHTAFRQPLIHPQVTLFYELKNDYISLVLVWANRQNPDDLREQLKQL